jgi:hypothetical protein
VKILLPFLESNLLRFFLVFKEVLFQVLATIGGAGAIIFGLWKLFGRILSNRLKEQDRRKSEVQLERLRQTFSIQRIQTDRFSGSQYDVSLQLWDSLQSLQSAVDAAWEQPSKANITTLSRQLQATRKKVRRWSIFFDEADLTEIDELLQILEHFHAGKQALQQIRSESDLSEISSEEIEAELRHQIDYNRSYRERFKDHLNKLRNSFHRRFSRAEELLRI